jgi:signal transduction histidine kinase
MIQRVAAQGAGLPAVWIVDDSPLDAEIIRRSLAALYSAEVFTDGGAVLEHLAYTRPPDAVILDWHMPGISGLDVCHFFRSRAETQSTPILILTAQHDTHDLVTCLAAGADDFLTKPPNPAELSARIAALVRTKRIHERMETAEKAVRTLLMQLPEAVVSIDPTGRIGFVNMEAERMLGNAAQSIIGRTLQDVLPEFSFDRQLAGSVEAVALPDLVLRDRVYAPALRRYAGVNATETTVSFRDVTSERHHERERARLLASERAARTHAEQASRAKDEFLAIVSHELRTPLNAILGWTHMLRRGWVDEAKRARALEVIERNASAQQKLIEDILDVSRITSGKLKLNSSRVSPVDAVQAACEAVRLAAEAKAIELTVDTSGCTALVMGDPYRLQQVVWNLLSNAVKFTPRGGSVTVRAESDASAVSIVVRDTGQGISKDFLPYIFDRFRQADTGTNRSHGGLGLGLAIVRHLVETHGGSVSAESDGLEAGSTFTVRLPLACADGSGSDIVHDSTTRLTPAGSLGTIRVLVVDDDTDTRELVAEMLRERGAEAVTAASMSEALSSICDRPPHVVVSDIAMPTDDGYAFVERLRALGTEEGATPVIALTAFAGPQDRERALDAGFDAYISKPVSASELVALVEKLSKRAPA